MNSPNSGRKRLSDILMNSERDRLESLWKTTAAATDLSPIPAGEYECIIDRGELSVSRNNTLGYKITMSVRSGEYSGRKLWRDLWLSDAALPMAKRDLSKLGITSLDQLERPLPAGIIVKAKVALRRNDDGNEFNRITRFEVIAVEAPETDPFSPDEEEQEEECGTESVSENTDSEAPF